MQRRLEWAVTRFLEIRRLPVPIRSRRVLLALRAQKCIADIRPSAPLLNANSQK